VEKYGTAGQTTDDIMLHAHCILDAYICNFPVNQWMMEHGSLLRHTDIVRLLYFSERNIRKDILTVKTYINIVAENKDVILLESV
jgi:hypothetical protein